MGVQEIPSSKDSSASGVMSRLFEPLNAALLNVEESERYRLLASFLSGLAEQSKGKGDGRKSAPGGQVDTLVKQVQALTREKAAVEDDLRTTQADLSDSRKQLEGKQAKVTELQQIIADQSARLKTAERETEQLGAQLLAKNTDLHKAEVHAEAMQVKAQRAELALSDHSRVDTLEEGKRELIMQIDELRAQTEQLRADKDAEIEKLKTELRSTESSASEGGDRLLEELWQRLAATKPPLAEGHVQPNKQAALRLVDAFSELVRFVDDFDKSMRVFLNRYCQYHPSVKVPWEAYAKGDDLTEFARRTVAALGGRPVGPLKMRLRLLYSWTYAAMVGCDSAMESLASELQSHMMGPVGAGSDPNRKIRDYVKDDGPERFNQYIKELRSLRLAETYGRG